MYHKPFFGKLLNSTFMLSLLSFADCFFSILKLMQNFWRKSSFYGEITTALKVIWMLKR